MFYKEKNFRNFDIDEVVKKMMNTKTLGKIIKMEEYQIKLLQTA